jgi:hypothetical protein
LSAREGYELAAVEEKEEVCVREGVTIQGKQEKKKNQSRRKKDRLSYFF